MKILFKNYTLPEHPEVLVLLVFGIVLQVTDGSPFTLKERWMIVWETELPVEYFSQFVQKIIKTVLSMIVVVRCATTYAYVVSAMLVIFSLLKNYAPKLMLLWLLIAGVKSILLTFLEALAGVYVCSAFGQIRKPCVEFVICKSLEIIFAAYLWGNVLNIYQEMERKAEEYKKPDLWEQLLLQKEGGRQRGRSLPDESTLYKTACLNNFEFKDVPQIILQMLRRGDEMSCDSLLDPGMMLASVSNMGSFDNLKTSQSLGELGFVDLRSAQVVGLEEDETSTPQDKTLKFLKLTWSDVRRAQRNKAPLESDIYRIDQETWRRVVSNGTHISVPKRPRAEVFIREIQQSDPEEDTRKPRKRSFDLKFSWSFFNLYNKTHVLPHETDDEQDEESVIFREDEDEDEEGREETEKPTPLFMSNIKEEVVVNRIRLDFVSKTMKGNAYAELYKQDYMSAIGPEVFDKASKLRKVISFTRVSNYGERITSMELSAFSEEADKKKLNYNDESEEKIYQTSSTELEFSEFVHERQNTGDTGGKEELEGLVIASCEETVSALNEDLTNILLHTESDTIATHNGEKSENLKPQNSSKLLCERENSKTKRMSKNPTSPAPSIAFNEELADYYGQTSPYYRKRRIKIRRIGKQATATISSDSQNFTENSDTYCGTQSSSKAPCDQKNSESPKKPEMWSPQSNMNTSLRRLSSGNTSFPAAQNEQMYFLIDLFQKPLWDVLLTYYDLKKKIHLPKSRKQCSWYAGAGISDFLLGSYQVREFESEESQERNWKSGVLKAAEVYRRKSSQMKFWEIREDKFIIRKLLANYVKKYYSAKEDEELFLSLCVANGCRWSNCNNENLSDIALYSSEETDLPEADDPMDFCENMKDTEEPALRNSPCEEHASSIRCSVVDSLSNMQHVGFMGKVKLSNDDTLRLCNRKILRSDTDFEKLRSKAQDSFDLASTSKVFGGRTEEESVSSQESDEPISLYYSKAANLASPLLDVKRFIYPDHIHYSYKNVKKKGFDVDISGGFPLLVRESLTISTPATDSVSTHPEFAITRRPMDLSFATTNAFAEWQNNDPNDVYSILSEAEKTKSRQRVETCSNRRDRKQTASETGQNKNAKRSKRSDEKGHFSPKAECKAKVKLYQNRNFTDFKNLPSSKDYLLIEKLLKMHFQLNSKQCRNSKRSPVQISSTQLHSNKGRVNSTYNPAIFLQENKTRSEKKKMETQEERTKDMFARLEREALLHSKNLHKSAGPSRRI